MPARAAKGTAGRPSKAAAVRKPVTAAAVAYRKVIARGVPLHIVQVDPRNPRVRVAVAAAAHGIGYRDDWSRIIDRVRPAAAITGTYFCTTSALPVGSSVLDGRTLYQGQVGTAFTFTPTQGARLVACRPGSRNDWSGFDTVLCAGPRLLTGGRVILQPSGEGFRDPAIFARKRRTAVAMTRHGKLLFIAVEKPVRLRTLARALQAIRAVDAMCLDGGASAGLYHQGRTRVKPGRRLTNLLVIYDSASVYRKYVDTLIPSGPQIARATGDGPEG
jgi:uncharacterized protein YigE (DUF2233 family)